MDYYEFMQAYERKIQCITSECYYTSGAKLEASVLKYENYYLSRLQNIISELQSRA